LKYKISINEDTDDSVIQQELDTLYKNTSLNPEDIFAKDIQNEIVDLIDRGSKLASVGSVFQITRTMTSNDLVVKIEASYGIKRNFIDKLLSIFKN